MINIIVEPALLLGVLFAVVMIILYSLRFITPQLSTDWDIFITTLGIVYSSIIVIHGWRLDPILLFSQVLIITSLLVAGWENIRLRGLLANITKIKKKENEFTIELVKTKDIAGELGKQKRENQTVVGFALETNDEEANAKEKLQKKNFDFIVLNSMRDEGAGFQTDTNKITILDRTGNVTKFDLKPKTEVAKDIVSYVQKTISKK